jgi:hypothetical protein
LIPAGKARAPSVPPIFATFATFATFANFAPFPTFITFITFSTFTIFPPRAGVHIRKWTPLPTIHPFPFLSFLTAGTTRTRGLRHIGLMRSAKSEFS